MAQGKNKGAKENHAKKHLNSRISYLYKAATYLADIQANQKENNNDLNIAQQVPEVFSLPDKSDTTAWAAELESSTNPSELRTKQTEVNEIGNARARNLGLSRQLLSHVRAVSLKGVVRLTPDIKHSICKRCDGLLIRGSTAKVDLENKSRDGRKPWADVLNVSCITCGSAKRFPVGAKRQLKRQHRLKDSSNETTLKPAAT